MGLQQWPAAKVPAIADLFLYFIIQILQYDATFYRQIKDFFSVLTKHAYLTFNLKYHQSRFYWDYTLTMWYNRVCRAIQDEPMNHIFIDVYPNCNMIKCEGV